MIARPTNSARIAMDTACRGIGLVVLLALAVGRALAAEADPQGGSIADGRYANPYFGLTYPLPPGWREGLAPARPSVNGYYVLETLKGPERNSPTILFAAQDLFFVGRPMANAMDLAAELRNGAASQGYTADQPAANTTIGGHDFARLALHSAVLSRLILATDMRCHIVSITVTAPDAAQLDELAAGFEALTLSPEAGSPVCIKDYATGERIRHRVEPALSAPKFLTIPVRIIIGADGKVEHVHVIRASVADTKAIEDAVIQWQIEPYVVNGQPVSVETGLAFERK
jgi:hypothetical protein